MIVDSAIYVDGRREPAPDALGEVYEACREKGGFAWIGLYQPTQAEFGLHELAVKDALKTYQRPKIERYGETLFVVLKAARYNEKEEVEFGEVHAFVGSDFVVTVRHGSSR